MNPRHNLKVVKIDYRALPSSHEQWNGDGIYWNSIHGRVEAIKEHGVVNGVPVRNVIAWIDAVVLDCDGLLAFVNWERTLWG